MMMIDIMMCRQLLQFPELPPIRDGEAGLYIAHTDARVFFSCIQFILVSQFFSSSSGWLSL
jgi:hypothetical protein